MLSYIICDISHLFNVTDTVSESTTICDTGADKFPTEVAVDIEVILCQQNAGTSKNVSMAYEKSSTSVSETSLHFQTNVHTYFQVARNQT